VCRYLLVAADGAVAAAGSKRADAAGTCRLEFARAGGRAAAGGGRLALAAVLEDNSSGALVKLVPW
jgi:hypothetical protein